MQTTIRWAEPSTGAQLSRRWRCAQAVSVAHDLLAVDEEDGQVILALPHGGGERVICLGHGRRRP